RLTNEALRPFDRHVRRRATACDVEERAGREREDRDDDAEPSKHGPHSTSLITSRVPTGGWRYRLGVRTRGSQPRDRGSNPRTATRSYTFPSTAAPAVGRGFSCVPD